MGCWKRLSKNMGIAELPRGYKTDDGYRLGLWVHNQRRTKDKMDPDRRQRLEALPGWSWDAHVGSVGGGFLSSETVFRP